MSKTNDELWTVVLTEMKKTVSQATIHTLFKNTYLLSIEDSIATIATPSTMIIDLLQKRYAGDIRRILSEQLGKDIDIIFITKVAPKTLQKEEQDDSPLFVPDEKPQKPLTFGHLPRVRPDFTFESFAVSASNQLAFVSAQTVAQNIGRSYNPLFLYGPVGVGKTHLMHAVANDVYQKDPSKKILYVTSEEFTNEVIDAIRTNDTAKMKRRFRSAFLLLIDDIQFIEGKERVQEELFHTFNILIDQGSQICLSSDRPPHEIKRLEKRLSSRFAGGLTVDISTPDFELKAAILGIKAKKYGHDLPADVIAYLAERAEDTRSLEGLLLRVITQATTGDHQINIELAQKALGNMVEEKKRHLHADDIIDMVCEYYKIKQTQLKGPKRNAALVKARQVTMYLIQKELKLTLVEIGNLLGGRDHTTIMHGVDKIGKLVENKAEVSEDIMGITKSLRG
jgi:chromosomal replication initiator protein